MQCHTFPTKFNLKKGISNQHLRNNDLFGLNSKKIKIPDQESSSGYFSSSWSQPAFPFPDRSDWSGGGCSREPYLGSWPRSWWTRSSRSRATTRDGSRTRDRFPSFSEFLERLWTFAERWWRRQSIWRDDAEASGRRCPEGGSSLTCRHLYAAEK